MQCTVAQALVRSSTLSGYKSPMLRHKRRSFFVFVPKPVDETCSSHRNAPVELCSTTRRCLLKSQNFKTRPKKSNLLPPTSRQLNPQEGLRKYTAGRQNNAPPWPVRQKGATTNVGRIDRLELEVNECIYSTGCASSVLRWVLYHKMYEKWTRTLLPFGDPAFYHS